MRPLKILLDVDGVLAQTTEKVLELYNKEHDQNVCVRDLTHWHFEQCACLKHDANKWFLQEGFFRDIKVAPGAQEMVRTLSRQGHDLLIATAITYTGYADRHDWLEEWFPEIPASNYLFGSRKDVLTGDFILDDKVANLIGSNVCHPVILDRPWNGIKAYPEARGVARVMNFNEFVDHVAYIAKKERKCG